MPDDMQVILEMSRLHGLWAKVNNSAPRNVKEIPNYPAKGKVTGTKRNAMFETDVLRQ